MLTLFGDVFERVRAEYVDPVSDRTLIENAISGMLSGLDPHSAYMNPQAYADMSVQTRGEFGGLGMEVTAENGFVKVVSPIDGTPAALAGLKPGDLITSIDGTSTQGMTLDESVRKMRGAPGSKVRLVVKRVGSPDPSEVTLERKVVRVEAVKAKLVGNTAYIRLSTFSEQAEPEFRKAYEGLRDQAGGKLDGLVLDLRNNPGGLLEQAIALSDDFLDTGTVVSTRARRPMDSRSWLAKPGQLVAGLPVVVLVNGGSASASEIVAGALQDNRRAAILGTRTFGKGSVQSVVALGSEGGMRLTTARYYTPSGRSIQGLGITPDVEVAETRQPQKGFVPDREASLPHALNNPSEQAAAQPRDDLPPAAHDIPALPPEGFPALEPGNPEADFQLRQALVLVHDMAAYSVSPLSGPAH